MNTLKRLLRFWPDITVSACCWLLAAGALNGPDASQQTLYNVTSLLCVNAVVLWLFQRQRRDQDAMAQLHQHALGLLAYQSQSLSAIEREMRNTLNGITGYAEYVAHHASDPMLQFTGTIIHENSLKLAKTADVMLDLIHRQDGDTLPCTSFSLHRFFDALRHEFDTALQEKTLLLECQIDPALPNPLHGKGTLVRKVIANLTENAIRFCDTSGRIRISAELTQDQHHVHVRVEDDGHLIAPNVLASLSENDAPLLSGTAHALGDAGVSLALAHRLAVLTGGRLHHTPTTDKGNMFHFFFPLTPPERTA